MSRRRTCGPVMYARAGFFVLTIEVNAYLFYYLSRRVLDMDNNVVMLTLYIVFLFYYCQNVCVKDYIIVYSIKLTYRHRNVLILEGRGDINTKNVYYSLLNINTHEPSTIKTLEEKDRKLLTTHN